MRPPPLREDPEQTMREARQRFIAAFPTQCDSIALLVNSIATLGARGPMGALRQALHRMTGLAGTIGFPTVSQRAGELEMLIAVADRDPLDMDRARTTVDAIREAFARDLTSPPPWAEHAASSPAAGVQNASGAYTVVLAEDDPEVTRVVELHMKAAGYRTFVAFDGEQAIAAVRTQKPDVLLLDMMTPKMTGFDVLAALRNAHPRPRIVVLSARGREDDVTRAFELGADDYLTKPFSPQELLARVARLLR